MKRIFCLSFVAVSLLSSTVYADDVEDTQSSAIETDSIDSVATEPAAIVYAPSVVRPTANRAEIQDSFAVVEESGWRTGIALHAGVGPAVDLRDPCFGYSARFGAEFHEKYWGLGLEVTWYTQWSTASASSPNHRHGFADETSNSGLMLLAHGYLPTSDHFVASIGAGLGFGARYEYFSDAPEIKRATMAMDPSWLVRVQTGAMWLVTDRFTLGFDVELNLGNYWSELPRWDSDDELDISLGAILTFSYQFYL